jgi:integrase
LGFITWNAPIEKEVFAQSGSKSRMPSLRLVKAHPLLVSGLGMIGWHTLRHTYRSWMDNNGTPLGIQKDLMRHTDIKMTMNGYGS